MSARTTSARLAAAISITFGLIACASDPPVDAGEEEANVEQMSSPLPLAAVSTVGASFAGLGLGAATPVGTLGTVGTIGANTGTVGASTQVGSSFGTGPIGFSTGPLGFSTSFDTGPIGFSTGGTTTISSGTGSAPVISHTCVGVGCL